MVVALSNVWKCKHSERIERSCSFAQSAASRWGLIENEGKSTVEPANRDERRYRSFDIGRARTHRDQAKIGPGNGAHGQPVVRGGGIDDGEPDPLPLQAGHPPFQSAG